MTQRRRPFPGPQVSTREEDWLVDTLALRSHMHLLQPVFTDPGKVKVT